MKMVSDKSEAWVQTSPAKRSQHDSTLEHALLGLKTMRKLGLYLDHSHADHDDEHCAVRTARMRSIKRKHDVD